MTKIRGISEVNKKILREINKTKVDTKTKQLLKDILTFELENIDKERVQYTEGYDRVFSQHEL